jgi:hypothetical protein
MAGAIDPLGQRKNALDAFLETKVAEGFRVETHTDTHAIIIVGVCVPETEFSAPTGVSRPAQAAAAAAAAVSSAVMSPATSSSSSSTGTP